MNFYDKKVRKIMAITIMIIIVAMVEYRAMHA